MTVVSRRGDEGKEGGGCRGGGGAKREARATTRAQVFVARGHVKFAEGSVQSVIVDPCSIPKGPVSGLDHHWALNDHGLAMTRGVSPHFHEGKWSVGLTKSP